MNRRHLRTDEAISPVIATIMMVAIAVVLAATVYLFASSMGTRHDEPPKFISLTSQGMLAGGVKTYTIAQGLPPGLHWDQVAITLNGEALEISSSACTLAPPAGEFQPCSPSLESAAGTLDAGDTLRVAASTGDVLRIIDPSANAVMSSVTVV